MTINEPQRESVDSETRAAGHEPDVVNVRLILLSGFALFVLMFGSFLLMLAMWHGLDSALGDDPTVGIDSKDETPVPPGVPELDPDQATQLVHLREAQRAWLNEYAWEDRAEGIARIPIERAIEIIAKNGLPKTTPATVTEVAIPANVP